MHPRLRFLIATASLGAALLAGQALAAPGDAAPAPAVSASSPDDPLEATNRVVYASQTGLDHAVFLPLAKVYHFLTPGLVGVGIHNMLQNLGEPVTIVNNLLQGRITDAARETFRLAANSTFGAFGAIDVAKRCGAPHVDNDFGMTLGRLGVGPGPYLYLPLLGPTDARDLLGSGVDVALNPLTWTRFPGHRTLTISSGVLGVLDLRINSEVGMEAVLSDAADPYATLRSVYLQNRQAQIDAGPGDTGATPTILPPLEDEPSAPSDAAQPAPDATPPAPADTAPAPAAAPVQPAPAPPAACPAPGASPGPGAMAAPMANPAQPASDDQPCEPILVAPAQSA